MHSAIGAMATEPMVAAERPLHNGIAISRYAVGHPPDSHLR